MWFAVFLNPQREIAVAALLHASGLGSYAPVYQYSRRAADGVTIVELPLFPRYVFCRCGLEAQPVVLGTPDVRAVVSIKGKPVAVGDAEIAAMQLMIGSGFIVTPFPLVPAGQRVRVFEGALIGLEGLLIRETERYRVVVNIEVLNCAASVEIDPGSVRAVFGDPQSPMAELHLQPKKSRGLAKERSLLV